MASLTNPTSVPYSVFIRGIPDNPAIKQVNVRSGPGTTHDVLC